MTRKPFDSLTQQILNNTFAVLFAKLNYRSSQNINKISSLVALV